MILRSALIALAISATPGLAQDAPAPGPGAVGIAPQLLVGTSGFEPGLAVEVPLTTGILRPELFLSEDGRLGAGASMLWDLSKPAQLDDRQRLGVGPRLVYHNSDDAGWELGGMVIWSIALAQDHSWRHALELIGAAGLVDERHDDGADLGLSVGIGYVFHP